MLLWAAVGFAEARELTKWVDPDWTAPDRRTSCTATLDVAADGTSTVRKVSGCKSDVASVTAALSQWRYRPAAASVEDVEVSHTPGSNRATERVAPEWASEAEAADGRTCFGQVWIDDAGNLTRVEVTGCGDAAKATFDATLRRWKFPSSAAAWTTVVPGQLLENVPEPTSRANPVFPDNTTISTARCLVLAKVDATGKPTVDRVLECPEEFVAESTGAVGRWRYPKTDGAWSTVVAVTFVKNASSGW